MDRHLVAAVLQHPVAHPPELVDRSFAWGIIRFVISNQTSVSCLSQASVSSTGWRCER